MTPEEIEQLVNELSYSAINGRDVNRAVIVKAIAAGRKKDRELLAEARGWLLHYGPAGRDITETVRDLVRRIEGRL